MSDLIKPRIRSMSDQILANTHHQLFRPLLDIEATTTFLVTLTEGAFFALGVLLGVLQVVR
jgi:Na+-translocating ferredoxin:NAD+ oxidoreductase RnfE subunit